MKNISQALQLAIKNIQSRFFHTFLSVLGIIIGVAALVSMLSLIDGLEKFVKNKIEENTSFNTVIINAPDTEVINDVIIEKENVQKFDYQLISEMMAEVDEIPRYVMQASWNKKVKVDTHQIATTIEAIATYESDEEKLKDLENKMAFGKRISPKNVQEKNKVAIVNEAFAKLINAESESLLNQSVDIDGKGYFIQGIVKDEPNQPPLVQIPISLFTEEELSNKSTIFFAQAKDVTKLRDLQTQMKDWISTNYPDKKEDINVEINEFRIDQVEQGFLFFRLIMGLIVGISVIVGGVGIMNVMLISLKERTPEIGIRKAIGAKRKDILAQFLAESVFISFIGSLLGVIIGIVFTAIAVPIINAIVKKTGGDEMVLHAAYTLNTLLIISVIAVLMGIIFGTYPAIRASKLKPVDAIRRV